MGEILHPQFGSKPRSVDARSAAFANIERHSVKAMHGNTLSEMILGVMSRFDDAGVSSAAGRALRELAEMDVNAPCDSEPTEGDAT